MNELRVTPLGNFLPHWAWHWDVPAIIVCTKPLLTMGKRYCVCCSNYLESIVEGRIVSLYRFPADRRLRRIWISRLRLIRKDLGPIKDHTRVCSEHFVVKKGPQPGDDVPSNFPQQTFRTTALLESSVLPEPDASIQKEYLTFTNKETETGENHPYLQPKVMSVPAVSVMLHDYCGYVKKKDSIQNLHCSVAACQTDTETTINVIMIDQRTQASWADKDDKNTQTDPDIYCSPLRYGHFMHNDSVVSLYTGC